MSAEDGDRTGAGRPERGKRPKPPRRGSGPSSKNRRTHGAGRTAAANAIVDVFTMQAIEIAGVMAEEAVHPFLSSRTEPAFKGVSAVELHFLDAATRRSFQRTRAARFITSANGWYLVRRWAEAGGDGALDEEMCGVVVRYLNEDFSGRLRAGVVTWLFDDRR